MELQCDNVICAGDLWHEKYGVNPDVLCMVYAELAYAQDVGAEWILLRGNHEISSKLNPHRTLLSLFSEVAITIVKPKLLKANDYELYMLPWYLADEYIKHAANLAANAHVSSCQKKILISHIGLNEGQLSPSNYYRAPQRVWLNHLRAHSYNLVLLGDYHMHQVLSDRVMYGGAPIQHAFGDAPNQGLWLLDLTGQPEVTNVQLRKRYPIYHTVELEQGQALPTLEPQDHYRIRLHVEDYARYDEGRFGPRIVFDPYGIREVDDSTRRLTHIDGDDPVDLFRALMEVKGIQKQEYWQIGEHFVKRAMTELYGKRS